MEYHNAPGMRLVIEEGDDEDMYNPPPELAHCSPPSVKHRGYDNSPVHMKPELFNSK